MSGIRKTSLGRECDQDWNTLPVTGPDSRHCELCSKQVTDFTSWARKDILTYYKQHPKACGRFTIEQIDPSIIAASEVFKRPRLFLAAVFSAIGLHSTFAQNAPEPVKTVQTPDTASAKKMSCDPVPEGISEEEYSPDPDDVAPIKKRSKLYFSARFPFVHKRRPYRNFGGCPSF